MSRREQDVSIHSATSSAAAGGSLVAAADGALPPAARRSISNGSHDRSHEAPLGMSGISGTVFSTTPPRPPDVVRFRHGPEGGHRRGAMLATPLPTTRCRKPTSRRPATPDTVIAPGGTAP